MSMVYFVSPFTLYKESILGRDFPIAYVSSDLSNTETVS